MKKAIVIAITMVLGLGLTAFAGPLSGSWASSLVVDPAASNVTSLSSTPSVDYTVGSWTFGAPNSFTLSDFTSQSFTASGSFTTTFDRIIVAMQRFPTLKTEGSISIGGVELGALFYIDQGNYDVTATDCVANITSETTYAIINWAKFEVDASVGVASNNTLDLGFNVSAFARESLEVGFPFEF